MGSHDQACKVANEGISLATLYIVFSRCAVSQHTMVCPLLNQFVRGFNNASVLGVVAFAQRTIIARKRRLDRRHSIFEALNTIYRVERVYMA